MRVLRRIACRGLDDGKADRGSRALLAGLLALGLISAAPAPGATRRLSQEPPEGDWIGGFAVSSDGQIAVYERETALASLWSVPLSGGTPTALMGPNLSSSVVGFAISPDSTRVVYVATQDSPNDFDLYSVSILGPGSSRVRLNPSLVAGGDVAMLFGFTPDSSTVIYVADQDTNDVREIYSVAASGGPATKLNSAAVAAPGVHQFQVSPDSSRVVFSVLDIQQSHTDLWSSPVGGGGAALIADQIDWFEVSRDGSHVLYTQGGLLKSQPIAGGVVLQLSNGPGGPGSVLEPLQSADGSRVVYADRETNDPLVQLFSVATAGEKPVALREPGQTNSFVPGTAAALSPDSSMVVFGWQSEPFAPKDLFSVPIGGGPSVQLNTLSSLGSEVRAPLQITSDSSRLVYRWNPTDPAVDELYSVPLGGGPSRLLSPPGPPGSVYWNVLNPEGSRVAFLFRRQPFGSLELYTASVTGGSPYRLDRTQSPDGTVVEWINFTYTPDGSGIVYRADEDGDGRVELYFSEDCRFCDGFESADLGRWSSSTP